MTADASSGAAPGVRADDTAPAPGAVAVAIPVVGANDTQGAQLPAPSPPEDATAPAADLGWQHSSLDLLTGVEVTDFSESISGEAFHALFRP